VIYFKSYSADTDTLTHSVLYLDH